MKDQGIRINIYEKNASTVGLHLKNSPNYGWVKVLQKPFSERHSVMQNAGSTPSRTMRTTADGFLFCKKDESQNFVYVS